MVYVGLYLVAGYLVSRQVWPLSMEEDGLGRNALRVVAWPAELLLYALLAR